MPYKVLYSDDFNRADGPLGVKWTSVLSTVDVKNNAMQAETGTVGNPRVVRFATATNNLTSFLLEITYLPTVNLSTHYQISYRATSGLGRLITFIVFDAPWRAELQGMNGDTGLQAIAALHSGDVLGLLVDGTKRYFTVNGAVILTLVGEPILQGQFAGLNIQPSQAELQLENGNRLDNFQISIPGGSGSPDGYNQQIFRRLLRRKNA